MPVVVHIPPHLFVVLLLVGAALLGLWTLARFDRSGPRTIVGAMLAQGVSLVALLAVPPLVDWALGLPYGRVVIVFAIALPVFTYFFLAAGWFARAVLRLFPR